MISILLVDNHDSFTYNLLETLRQTHLCTIDVFCLEQMNDIELAKYQGVILSPGPGLPSEKKGLNTLISAVVNASIPLLGVCLGHQAIAQYFGAELLQLKQIIHGEASIICVFGDSNFYHKIKKNLQVGRYHSWVINERKMPDSLEITTATSDGLIMSFKHKKLNVRGVQFHPESILTPQGSRLLANWLHTISNEQIVNSE